MRAIRSLAAAALLLALAVPFGLAQPYYSPVVDFEDGTYGDPANDQEMFRVPQTSGSTSEFIVANAAGSYANNAAFRDNVNVINGSASLRVYFKWVDPADPNAWLRLTTISGEIWPNPSIHLAGKVRFWVINEGDFIDGQLGVCLGVRETGEAVPLFENGGFEGDIEWVGVTGTVGTTPDIRPLPAYTIPVQGDPVLIQFDLATGHVWAGPNEGSLVDYGGTVAALTGNGVLDGTRGVLEHIAFVNVAGDPLDAMSIFIDDIRAESPDPDPVYPPTIQSPIIKDDLQITVIDLLSTADQVTLYRDNGGGPLLVETLPVVDPNGVVFTLATAAQSGECFTATQRESISGDTSGPSDAVCALPAPATYTFSIVIDEDGSNCDYNWEFVPVTSRVAGPTGQTAPQGQIIYPDGSRWQTLDIPLDNANLTTAWLGGTGEIEPQGTGIFSIDSFWFTSLGGATATETQEVFIDAIQALDADDNVIATFQSMDDGVNYLANTRGQSSTPTTLSSALSTLTSYDGATSHRVVWTYADALANQTLALFHGVGYACGTSPTFPDTTKTVRIHLLARQPITSATPQPTVVAPIVGNQTGVRVENDPNAVEVQLWINGAKVGSPVLPSSGETDFGGLALTPGDSVSATQTLNGEESDFAYPIVVAAQPSPPGISAPIVPLATTVTLTAVADSVFATSDAVEVYVNDAYAGTATPAGATVDVTVPQLQTGDAVKARQHVNGAWSEFSAVVLVSYPAPVIYYAPAAGQTAVRMTNIEAAADTLKITVDGTTTYTMAYDPNFATVDVPTAALTMGQTVVATYIVGGIESIPSAAETVTVATSATLFSDNFEYADQAAYEAVWQPYGSALPLVLTDAYNTSTGGLKSVSALTSAYRNDAGYVAGAIPTDTHPVVFQINIFDTTGGTGYNQYADLNTDPNTFFLAEIGISTLSGTQTHYQGRLIGAGGPNWVNLDQFDGPSRSAGWHNFTMVFKGPAPDATTGHEVDMYVDGLLARKNVKLTTDLLLRNPRIGSGLGTSYGTTLAYYDDYRAYVGPISFPVLPPGPPKVQSPLEAGDTTVTVTNVRDDAASVNVYANDVLIGSIVPTGETTVVVPVVDLVHLDAITATQMIGTTEGIPSTALEVGKGDGDILLSLGIRETGDTGALGTTGGTSGQIEFIGAATKIDGAPQGIPISPSYSWQTVIFDPAGDIVGFTGDGILQQTRGVIEHLAVAVNSTSADRSTGAYRMFVDNVVNVGADTGGLDFVITDFDSFTPGVEALFQEPGYSGSTSANIVYPPDYSRVSAAYGNPGQSEELGWFWVDTQAKRWLRITTSGTANVSRPIIDLTKPVRMDILLLPACLANGDMDGDGFVTAADLDLFLDCLSGPDTGGTPTCNCGDFNGDGDIDLADVRGFQAAFGS